MRRTCNASAGLPAQADADARGVVPNCTNRNVPRLHALSAQTGEGQGKGCFDLAIASIPF